MIDATGADALRFSLIHGATPGIDQKFSQDKLENARNFANKLWNAARYVLGARPSSIAPDAPRVAPDVAALGPAERWLRSRVAATTAGVDQAMADFAFAEVTRLLYEAIWNEFCDWGLELAKVRLSSNRSSLAEREATWWTLVEALDTLPAAAPSGHAVRDRGGLGRHPARSRRSGAAHRRGLARRR